jgi:hypothetical protein
MAIVQISKIIHRTGANVDLPQLDAGEFGYATDQQRLYIGDDYIAHPPVSESSTTQTEVLTEHSTLSFNKIGGVANTSLTLNDVQTGQILVASGNVSVGNAWTNWDGELIGPDDIKLQLGAAETLSINGGLNGYFLQTDGQGNLTWTDSVGEVTIQGTPGGSNTQLQFNDAGDFGGSAYLTYNKVTHALTVDGEFNATGNINGNISGTHFGPVGNATVRSSGEFTTVTTVSTAIIGGNITAANVNSTGEVVSSGNVTAQNLVTAGEANVATLNVTGNVVTSLLPDTDGTKDLGSFWQSWGNLYIKGGNITLGSRVLSTDDFNLIVDGGLTASNATFDTSVSAATLTGTLTTHAQPNITSVGTLTSLAVTGVSNLGSNVANIKLGGGGNGFLLGTDGLANLRWVPNTELLRKPSGSNTQIQYNDGGDFGADSGLVYDKSTSTLTTSSIQLAGTLRTIGNITTAQVNSNGTITGTVITANTRFVGNGANLSQLNGANVTGTVANATTAVFAGTVTTGNQPNITGIGTLSSLSVTGTVAAGNASVVNTLTTNKIQTSSIVGNLIPDASGTQSLGTAAKRWKELYLAGTTIYLGTSVLQDTGGALTTNIIGSNSAYVGDATLSTQIDVMSIVSSTNNLFVSTDAAGVSLLSKANQSGSGVYIMDSTNTVSVLIDDGTGAAIETVKVNNTGLLPATGDVYDLGADDRPWNKAVITTTKTKTLDLNLEDDSGTFSMFANVNGIFVRNNMTDAVFSVNLTPVV